MRPLPTQFALFAATLFVFGSGCFFDFARGVDLEPGDIAGRAVDERGEPIAFARIEVPGTSRLTRTLGNGRFVLRGMQVGEWTLRLTVDDNGDGWPERAARRTAAITTEQHADGLFGESETRKSFVLLGDVVLGPAVDVTGTVRRDGQPAPGAIVTATPLVGAHRLPGSVNVGTDDEGRFRLVLPAYPFEIVAWQDELASSPESIAPADGEQLTVNDLVLGAVPGATGVELVTQPPLIESLIVGGRTRLPDAADLETLTIGEARSPVAFVLPAGVHDLYARDEAGNEGLLFAQSIPPTSDVVRLGAVDFGDTPCPPRGADCDGDGATALPDATDPANTAIYEQCAQQCNGAWGTGLAARTCFVDGQAYDCDDDGDGQPDTTEPAGCHGPGRGGDLDGDGTCDTADTFPRCVSNDPGDPLCSPFAAAPRPGPRPEYTGPTPDAGPPQDAGDTDAGGADAGDPDAGTPDGGPLDSGPVDAGFDDGGNVDAGVADSGVTDGGVQPMADAGPLPDGGCFPPLAPAIPADLSFAVVSLERNYVAQVVTARDSTIYLTGYTGSAQLTVTLGVPGARCVETLSRAGQHPWAASLDPTGGCRWLRVFEDEPVNGWRMGVQDDGTVLFDATHAAAATIDGVTLPATASQSAAVIRLRASDGSAIDGLDLGVSATGSIRLDGLVGLPDGGFAATGTLSADTTFGVGEANATTLQPIGSSHPFIAVFDCDLSLRWASLADPSLSPVSITAASLADPPGTHVFLAGETSAGTLYAGTASEVEVTGSTAAVAAYGPSGQFVWASAVSPLRNLGSVDVNDDGTLLAFSGTANTGFDIWSAGASPLGPDAGPGDSPTVTVTDPQGSGVAGVALYAPATGQALGGFGISGDSPYGYGLAFTSNTSVAVGGFVFADIPVSGPEGADAGVSRALTETQGAYIANVDVTDPSSPSTLSVRVADSDNDMWVEQGAFAALPDGSVVTAGYLSFNGRHDGVPGRFTGGTDRAWIWRSRDGDEETALGLDTAPCGPTGNPLAGDVLVEVYRDQEAFRGKFGYSQLGEHIDFDDVPTTDAGPQAIADDRYLAATGARLIAAGGRYVDEDFGIPSDFGATAFQVQRYAPGPVAAPGAAAGAGSNLTEVVYESGSCMQAATAGFGAAFVDADQPGTAQSALRVYDGADQLIHEELVSGGDGEDTYVGVATVYPNGATAPAVFRVEIVNGEGWPGTIANEGVALDDFRFMTPVE